MAAALLCHEHLQYITVIKLILCYYDYFKKLRNFYRSKIYKIVVP